MKINMFGYIVEISVIKSSKAMVQKTINQINRNLSVKNQQSFSIKINRIRELRKPEVFKLLPQDIIEWNDEKIPTLKWCQEFVEYNWKE